MTGGSEIIDAMKKNPIDYLFYKLVEFTIFLSGYGFNNDSYAPKIMSLLFLFNIPSILMWLSITTKMLFVIGSCVFVLLLALLAIVYWDKRSKKVLKRYEEESAEERIRGNRIVIWYVVLTLALFAFSLYIRNMK